MWPVSTEGRPPRRPRARAAASPAAVRSRIRSHSNSARAANTWKTSLAPGGGGVDHLLETAEPDPALGEFGNGVDQVPQGVTEAVELPNDEGVAGAELVQDLGEGGRSVRAPLAVSTNTRGLSDAEACLAGLLLPTAPA